MQDNDRAHNSIRELRRAADPVLAEHEFWRTMAATGTPLIERDPTDPDVVLVTFVFRADRDLDGVLVDEAVSALAPAERALERIAGTSTWWTTWRMRPDVRSRYSFIVVDGNTRLTVSDPLARVQRQLNSSLLGPHEEPPMSSIFELPDAEELGWADRVPHDHRGRVTHETFRVDDGPYAGERDIWLYEPSDRPAERLLVILDGQAHHSALTVLDNLHAGQAIRPTAAVLVRALDRNVEMACNAEWSDYLALRVLPWAMSRLGMQITAAETIITGCSLGGLCSAYTSVRHPNIFGNVLMQSGSVWFDRAGLHAYFAPASGETKVLGTRTTEPEFLTLIADQDRVPVRFHVEVGAFEYGPPPATPFQIYATRHFRDVLRAKGYAVTYHEFAGGHDDSWWRGRLGEALIALEGSTA